MGILAFRQNSVVNPNDDRWIDDDRRDNHIVGGGPSGMTLAWWLVEQGIPVTLLEREPEVPHDMRASTFHPATLDLLAPSD